MDCFILVRADSKIVKVTASSDGTVNEKTLRRAFQLEDDVPVGLFRNDLALEFREDNVFELQDGWKGAEFRLCWEEERRSRPVKSIQQDVTNVKKRKLAPDDEEVLVDGDLAASISRYALYYNVPKDNYKRSAVPLTPRLAATFRHGDNKSIEKGDRILIRSWADKEMKVWTRAVKIVEERDTIILESEEGVLCDRDFISNPILPRKGMRYLLMGFSILHNNTSHQSLSAGIMISEVTRPMHYTGSSGSFKGNSGGSCWSEDGQLIGMQIEVLKLQNTNDESKICFSTASGGRCSIVAIRDIVGYIEDLLQPCESDEEWTE